MIDDHIAELIARRLSGEISEKENLELDNILQSSPEASQFYQIFSNYWVVDPQKKLNEVQEEIHFQQIIAIAEKEKQEAYPENGESSHGKDSPKMFTIKQLLIAAAFAAVIFTGYFIFFNKPSRSDKQLALNQVEAKKGIRSSMLLPDGSKVWLNSDSKLEYTGNFTDSLREVTLTGEAFFDVVKEKARPFIVHTSDIDIRVLGTAFNVKSYPKEATIETTLIHGLIEVIDKNQPGTPNATLHPHQKLVYQKKTTAALVPAHRSMKTSTFSIAPLSNNKADTERVETSWVYNKLIFDGETFEEAALKMERWYNVHIIFKNEQAARLRIKYSIENETVEEALKALQVILKFSYNIRGNEIEIF